MSRIFPWRCACLVGVRGSKPERNRQCGRAARGRIEIVGLLAGAKVDACRTHYLNLKRKYAKVKIVRRYPLPKTSFKQLPLPKVTQQKRKEPVGELGI